MQSKDTLWQLTKLLVNEYFHKKVNEREKYQNLIND